MSHILFSLTVLSASIAFANDGLTRVEKDGVLLFEDDFQRDESTPDQEEIGQVGAGYNQH